MAKRFVAGGCISPLVLLFALACVGSGCDMPRDPVNTLERVRGGTLRVGIVENDPWVRISESEPSGVEIDLVKQFADEVGASRIEWVQGSEDELMEVLTKYDLDLVVGGLVQSSPWSKNVGFTRPYFQSEVVVGIPGTNHPPDLEGLEVAVQPPSAAEAILAKKGAVPVRMTDLSEALGPVAAPAWKIESLGMTPTRHDLTKLKHVMAVPPGENGWLVRLERFLLAREPHVKEALKEVRP